MKSEQKETADAAGTYMAGQVTDQIEELRSEEELVELLEGLEVGTVVQIVVE